MPILYYPANTQPDPEVVAKLYSDWASAGLDGAPTYGPETASVAVGQDIQAAIDGMTSGVVTLASGTYQIGSAIQMKSGVVLRGPAVIETTAPMQNMISMGGGFFQSTTVTASGSWKGNQLTVSNAAGVLIPGLLQIGTQSSNGPSGQVVKVISAAGNVLTLETELTDDFANVPVKDLAGTSPAITASGVEDVTLQPLHNVNDLIELRTADGCWITDVETQGVGGQQRAAIHLRQSYRCLLASNHIIDAEEHGDGGEGYGINLTANSSHILVLNNELEQLRHSILLHDGAAGCVVEGNFSHDACHPNFLKGGPADTSFHGWTSSCLVMNNICERIMIVDASQPGPYNSICYNTVTHGPITLLGGVDDLVILGNVVQGDINLIRNTVMPSKNTDSTAGNPSPTRPYWYSTPASGGAFPPDTTSPDPYQDSGMGYGIWNQSSGANACVERGYTIGQLNPSDL